MGGSVWSIRLAATLLGCLQLLPACHARRALPRGSAESLSQTVTRQVYLMGTWATLTVEAPDRQAGLARVEDFVRMLEEAEAQLSSWRPDSAIGRLNRHPVGSPFALEGRLCPLFERVFYWRRETGGAFDPALEPLIAAWGIRRSGRVPDQAELASALARSGLDRFRFDAEGCQIRRLAETGIDSGAFGKGAALDWIRESPAASAGPWLIDLGGQVAVGGSEGSATWAVALADPKLRDRPALDLRLSSGSLATSGGSERDLESDGQRVGHILDPRDGRPAAYRGSVTVWHESALAADVLSTALYVMGPEDGLAWAAQRGIAALYLSGDGGANSTPEFRKRFPGSEHIDDGKATVVDVADGIPR